MKHKNPIKGQQSVSILTILNASAVLQMRAEFGEIQYVY